MEVVIEVFTQAFNRCLDYMLDIEIMGVSLFYWTLGCICFGFLVKAVLSVLKAG